MIPEIIKVMGNGGRIDDLADGGVLHKLIMDRKDSPQDDWPGLDCMRPVNEAGLVNTP